MFQLNKSQTVNTIAFYPNELTTGSAILLEFTQSYSNTVTGSFQATVISDPLNTPWIIAQFSGSLLPSASGQYNFKIFELVSGGPLIWNLVNTNWNVELATWDTTSGGITIGDQISEERAIISGSDVTPITEYLSPNENARYKVYLG
jgi:hypothetical protein